MFPSICSAKLWLPLVRIFKIIGYVLLLFSDTEGFVVFACWSASTVSQGWISPENALVWKPWGDVDWMQFLQCGWAQLVSQLHAKCSNAWMCFRLLGQFAQCKSVCGDLMIVFCVCVLTSCCICMWKFAVTIVSFLLLFQLSVTNSDRSWAGHFIQQASRASWR